MKSLGRPEGAASPLELRKLGWRLVLVKLGGAAGTRRSAFLDGVGGDASRTKRTHAGVARIRRLWSGV